MKQFLVTVNVFLCMYFILFVYLRMVHATGTGGNRKLLIGLCGGFGAGVAYQKTSFTFDSEISKFSKSSSN